MTVLLDTNAIVKLGGLGTPLSAYAVETIKSSKRILISPVARAEIAIKFGSGKFPFPVKAADYWSEVVSRLQGEELPFTCAHAEAMDALPPIHRDPFDRMIIAQAILEDVAVTTTDVVFSKYGIRTVI